jgi:hypothetical protein
VAALAPREPIVLGWQRYLALFDGARHEKAIGEASVAYLASLGAASAIRGHVPNARIVMILRNPIDRLFSRFLSALDAGETATFTAWLDRQVDEDARRSPPAGPIWPGRYAVHLQRYLDTFPASQVRVLLYDDFVRDPRRVMRDLLSFLDVDPDHPIDTTWRHNVTLTRRWPALHARVKPLGRFVPRRLAARARPWFVKPRTMKPTSEERQQALAVYRDDIRVLEKLIQRDLSAWSG